MSLLLLPLLLLRLSHLPQRWPLFFPRMHWEYRLEHGSDPSEQFVTIRLHR